MKYFTVSLIIVVFLAFIRLFSFFLSPLSPNSQNPPTFSAFARLNRPTNFIDQSVKQLYPEPQASLLSGILVGTKASMPKDFYHSLQKTGTLHIIALSGTNITMLISFFDLLFKPLGKRKSSLFSIFAIIIFILFVGPSASVVRAGIMGSLNLIAILFGRRNLPLLSLVITALIMVILSPQIIIDIGFQLSFLATLGIMLFAGSSKTTSSFPKYPKFPKFPNFLKPFFAFLKSELRLTLSAQAFTLPVILFNFHSLSLIAPLTNMLVGWTIPYLMAGGFLIVFFSLLVPRSLGEGGISPISQIFSWPLLPFLNWFIWIIKTTGAVHFASVNF